MRLKDESDTIQYSCKQQVEQDISNYLKYIEHDLNFKGHGKDNIFLGLFVKTRSDIDFIIKSIIDKQISWVNGYLIKRRWRFTAFFIAYWLAFAFWFGGFGLQCSYLGGCGG